MNSIFQLSLPDLNWLSCKKTTELQHAVLPVAYYMSVKLTPKTQNKSNPKAL